MMARIEDVYRRTRKLDRLNARITATVEAMKRGAVLRLTYTRHGPKWSLSPDGSVITAEVAAAVITSQLVISDPDSLFSDAQPQTYRYRFASGIAPNRSL